MKEGGDEDGRGIGPGEVDVNPLRTGKDGLSVVKGVVGPGRAGVAGHKEGVEGIGGEQGGWGG